MKITDALLGEHGAFYALFDRIESRLGSDPGSAGPLAELLAAALLPHARIENDHLFAALEPTMGPAGPLAVMRAEHDEIEGAVNRAASEADAEVARGLLLHAISVAREHFAKEEQVLFPMATQALGEDKLEELGRVWAGERGVRLA